MPVPPSMSKGNKRRLVFPIKILLSAQGIKNKASRIFSRTKNSMLTQYDGSKKILEGDVENEAEKSETN